MAHFAQLDDENIVAQVIVVSNDELLVDGVEDEAKGVAFCQGLLGGRWVQTSYSGRFRQRFAGIGYSYDAVNDRFLAPQPFPSWSLGEDGEWQPPVARPDGIVSWDEDAQVWR